MNWLKSFFAVDNEVNEDTVVGTLLLFVAIGGWVAKALGVDAITQEMLYIVFGASLAAFGIGGFKG